MPRRILLEEQRDFTGGLNLAVDPFDLEPNESPLMVNVDLDRRGGFGLRRGCRTYIEDPLPTGTAVGALIPFYNTSGTHQLLVGDNAGRLYTWNGTAWVLQLTGGNAIYHWAQMNDLLYVTNASNGTVDRWNGTVFASITAAGYNDDLTAPAGGRFPQAGATVATHANVMWVGNFIDSIDAARHVSRVRWSHPGTAEDWRTNDYIDIDPNDGCGQIRMLVPFQERLLVFKDRAVYAIHGYPPNGFSVQNLTREVGASSIHSVIATEEVVYFSDARTGANSYDGKQFQWIFEKIFPLIDDERVRVDLLPFASLCFHNRRLWLSTRWLEEPYENIQETLVFDPRLGGGKGAWTFYSNLGSIVQLSYRESDGSLHLLGQDGLYVMENDVEGLFEDQEPDGNSEIRGEYQTRWFDAKNFALRKRWKRPEVVMRDNANLQLNVDVFTDYNPNVVKRSFSFTTEQDGTELVWDVDDWDEAVWAGESGDRAIVKRGSPLGNARAISLKFRNINQTGTDWRVHAIINKYIPKRIRN